MIEKLSDLIGTSDCPVSISVHTSKCPEPPEPRKRLVVGSTIPLTFEWSAPDNWLARVSQRLAELLYKVRIHWSGRWGRWRMDSLETEAEVLQDDKSGLRLHVLPGVVTQGRRGTFTGIEEAAE